MWFPDHTPGAAKAQPSNTHTHLLPLENCLNFSDFLTNSLDCISQVSVEANCTLKLLFEPLFDSNGVIHKVWCKSAKLLSVDSYLDVLNLSTVAQWQDFAGQMGVKMTKRTSSIEEIRALCKKTLDGQYPGGNVPHPQSVGGPLMGTFLKHLTWMQQFVSLPQLQALVPKKDKKPPSKKAKNNDGDE